ncbi:uncharacterized protein YukE [Paenibacillus anaericanus]|uniref:WXG100 family type VII secretion target n=1 Tax=Paenibacillus anaericanus TaxID=170367 RepID=UPI0027801255|nr:WXG100 family type VII secretion target [Paenibacillus anaericanus]MDQ0087501.1 uncharacterized protein YukE [Paenibacillus anaericanus]
MKIEVEVPDLKQTGRDLQQTVHDLENMQSSLQRMMSRLTLESRGRADVDNTFRMINQRLNEIRQELEALSRQATKKGEQFEEADGKGKPIDLRQAWSFVKKGMMGLDFIPIIGNVDQIMKMAIGRDLNTEENPVKWKRDSVKLTDFADEEFPGVCVWDRDKIEEGTRNGFEKSIDSFQEIGSDFVTAAEERSNKAFDSFGDFLNYVTSGISSGIYEGAKERDERKMDSFYDFGDWLTSGLIGTINGAFNPKEGAFSKEHWLNSLGLAMMIAAPIRAKIPTTPNLRKNIVAPRQKTTPSGIEKQEKVDIKSPKTEELKPRKSEDLLERSLPEGTPKAIGNESVTKVMSENASKYKANLNYDCSEIADDLANAAGGNGEILTIRSSDKYGQIKVNEYRTKVDFDYHTVYSDGEYVYDPRYSDVPILKETYLEKLRQDNGGNIAVTNQKLE